MSERLLIVETSQRVGLVALAEGEAVLAVRALTEARRHARDLAPWTRELLTEHGWSAKALDGIVVSVGPGSYTGLRVGVMSAKTLAYATGCALVGVETFAAIARRGMPAGRDEQAPRVGPGLLDVIDDAQQQRIHVQRFGMNAELPCAMDSLRVTTFTEWAAAAPPGLVATGPGLEAFRESLPGHVVATPADCWRPDAASLLALGLERLRRGERDDPIALEPLYLRQSEAEAKRRRSEAEA